MKIDMTSLFAKCKCVCTKIFDGKFCLLMYYPLANILLRSTKKTYNIKLSQLTFFYFANFFYDKCTC